MKILKPGQIPEEKVLRGTCPRCKCEVECMAHEAAGCADPRDGSVTYTVECPTPRCRGRTYLEPAPVAPVCNAAATPANVLPISENCNHRLAREGKAYPRTCALCKLGPCAFRVRAPLPSPLPPPPGEQPMPDYRAFPRPDPYAACPLTIGGKPFTAEEFYNR